MNKLKICVIGCGLIGRERIRALKYINQNIDNNIVISSVFDTNKEVLEKIGIEYNVSISNSLEEALELKPDWVFISTPNYVVVDMCRRAFDIGANVLVEKPFGRSLMEAQQIIDMKPVGLKLHVGFNYRFFNGIEKALSDAKGGKFGKLINVNMILAHGNSPGMENSWKLDSIKCGSIATDLFVHQGDLCNILSEGGLKVISAQAYRGFWNVGADEESHILMKDDNGTIFNCQVSGVRWRSEFKLEINGTEGYGKAVGRGRSYGNMSYITGTRWGWHKHNKPQAETEIMEIKDDSCDNSFIKETIAVLGLKDSNNPIISTPCNYIEAKRAMELLNQYEGIVGK